MQLYRSHVLFVLVPVVPLQLREIISELEIQLANKQSSERGED